MSYVSRKKPNVSKVNKVKQIDFVKTYLTKSQELWDKVIFTDESKYNKFGSDGRLKVWRRVEEALNSKNTLKAVK